MYFGPHPFLSVTLPVCFAILAGMLVENSRLMGMRGHRKSGLGGIRPGADRHPEGIERKLDLFR